MKQSSEEKNSSSLSILNRGRALSLSWALMLSFVLGAGLALEARENSISEDSKKPAAQSNKKTAKKTNKQAATKAKVKAKTAAKTPRKKAKKKTAKAVSQKPKTSQIASAATTPPLIPNTELPLHVAKQEQMVESNPQKITKSTNPSKIQSSAAESSIGNSSSETTLTANAAAIPPSPQNKWSGSFSIGRTNSLYKSDNGEIQSNDFSASVTYMINSQYRASVVTDYSQDVKDAEAADFGRLAIAGAKSGWSLFNSRALLSPSISLGLPISRAHQNQGFQGSVGGSLKLDANSDYLFSKNLALGTGLGLTRNLHRYDSAVSGRINTQYNSSQFVSAGWSFTDALSLSGEIRHYNSINYAGSMKEFYSHSQELGYQYNKNLAISLGHQFGSPYTSVWKDDGQNYNFKVIDEDNSFVYGSVTLTVQ